MNARYRVDLYEHERGWGVRLDDVEYFDTKEDAETYQRGFNAKNAAASTPDWYMTAGDPVLVDLATSPDDMEKWARRAGSRRKPPLRKRTEKGTTTELDVLKAVDRLHDPDAGDVGAHIGKSSGTAGKYLRALYRAGCVSYAKARRTDHHQGHRSHRFTITARGIARLTETRGNAK